MQIVAAVLIIWLMGDGAHPVRIDYPDMRTCEKAAADVTEVQPGFRHLLAKCVPIYQ